MPRLASNASVNEGAECCDEALLLNTVSQLCIEAVSPYYLRMRKPSDILMLWWRDTAVSVDIGCRRWGICAE